MGKAKPFEIILETNCACNYSCSFCFADSIQPKPALPAKTIETIIEKIASEGIDRLRFTGGEPLLRKDLAGLLKFAKKQGLFTSLNTNASLFSQQKIKELSPYLDDVLVSMHAIDSASEQLLGGKPNSFNTKQAAIKALSKEDVFVRAATILTPENISQFELFGKAIEKMPISQWVLLRPIPNSKNKNPVSIAEMGKAIEKIYEFNKGKKKEEYSLIENALPFCCHNPEKTSKVSLGGIREDGHSTLFIDSSLSIKPSYFLDLKLGNALNDSIMGAWESDFMKRMRSLEFIAEQCHKCKYVLECMGGSRFSALFCNESLYALDPLAMPEKNASIFA